MATAKAPLAALHQISLDINGVPNQPGLAISNGDSIQFLNGARFAVSIQFICANGPVFNDILTIGPGARSQSQTAQKAQITTDYLVNTPTTSNGPYSIQVAINPQVNPAPLLIPITGGDPPANEKTVAVPQGGWIVLDLDASYTLNWTPSGVFPSGTYGPGQAGPFRAQNGNQNLDTSYTLDTFKGITGGGTVKIRS